MAEFTVSEGNSDQCTVWLFGVPRKDFDKLIPVAESKDVTMDSDVIRVTIGKTTLRIFTKKEESKRDEDTNDGGNGCQIHRSEREV
jgi:hypothetical protein